MQLFLRGEVAKEEHVEELDQIRGARGDAGRSETGSGALCRLWRWVRGRHNVQLRSKSPND